MQERTDNPQGSESGILASNMPNVVKVQCGAPATVQIEIYDARDGLAHGSLDGVLRMCAKHAVDLDEVISWDTSDPKPTIYRKAITRQDVPCGGGYDFVAGMAIPPFESAPAEVLGDDHPMVGTAIKALTIDGEIPTDSISRGRATVLLDAWAHRGELSDREVAVILAQFPETVAETVVDQMIASAAHGLASLACGQPATTHIEVFGPDPYDGEDRALRLSHYVCTKHTEMAAEVVALVDSTVTRIPPTAHCGAGSVHTGVTVKEVSAPGKQPEATLIVKAATAWLRGADTVPSNESDADSLLRHWAHYPEMTFLEIQTVAARFAEGADPGQEGDEVMAAYELGREIGRRSNEELLKQTDLMLLERIDAKLRNVEERIRRARAHGFVDGLAAQLEGGRTHAFTVAPFKDGRADHWEWLCRCKWVTHQYPADIEQTPVQDRLAAHLAEATAVDMRTAAAFDTDTNSCPCPEEIGQHQHVVYARRHASTGEIGEIVVNATARGQSTEVLCWTLTNENVARAVRWVEEHPARWEDSSPVTADELIRRAAGWLR